MKYDNWWRSVIHQIFSTSRKLERKTTAKAIKKESSNNPQYSELQLPEGERTYHALNLITDPEIPIVRGISIRSKNR